MVCDQDPALSVGVNSRAFNGVGPRGMKLWLFAVCVFAFAGSTSSYCRILVTVGVRRRLEGVA